MSFTESKKALKILIEGETSASHNYLRFAEKAEQEGLNTIAALFRALSGAELIHIKNHGKALGEIYSPKPEEIPVLSTLENLRTAINGETAENKKLYPSLIKKIKKETKSESGKIARLTMVWAQKAEAEHAKLLKKAFKSLKKGVDLDVDQILICRVCGNVIVSGESESECSVCGHDFLFFKKAA